MNVKHKYYFAAIISAALLLTGCQQKHTTEPEKDTDTQTLTEAQQPSTEEDISTQTVTETQTTISEHIIVTQTFADTGTTEQDTSPLSNIVRFEPIKLPDDINSVYKSKRTADGFSAIVYYGNWSNMAYMHISEDMQTVETTVLTPPKDNEGYHLSGQWLALGNDEIWEIALMEGHCEKKYLLCRYAEDGTLLSAIPANDLLDYPISSQINESFDCVGDVLYIILSDNRILQIDKETAEVTVVSELHKEEPYNDINLCFDRDDKPLLIQVANSGAPDVSPIVHEAVISEFDFASNSCGQTIYATGDDFNETHYFEVLKGSGEYRLFVNTGSKLLGIRDDGTQELLIDMDASDLFNALDLEIKYASTAGHDMQIYPIDDTHFLEIHNNYTAEPPKVFRLTRKHESEVD